MNVFFECLGFGVCKCEEGLASVVSLTIRRPTSCSKLEMLICTMVPECDAAYTGTIHLDLCGEDAMGAGVGVREPLASNSAPSVPSKNHKTDKTPSSRASPATLPRRPSE